MIGDGEGRSVDRVGQTWSLYPGFLVFLSLVSPVGWKLTPSPFVPIVICVCNGQGQGGGKLGWAGLG